MRLFGGVVLGNTALPGPRAKALILALALSRGRPVSTAALIEDVWGLDAPTSASTALHTMISRIRTSQWHGVITSTSTGYALGIAAELVDYWVVESLLAAARASLADPTSALELLATAKELTTGEAAAGTANSPALAEFILRTEHQRTALSRLSAQALAANGDHANAAELLGPLAAAAPLDEPLQLAYLNALSASGQANAALLAFDAFRRRLRRELGTSPSLELLQLHARLLRETSDDGTPPQAVSSVHAVPPDQEPNSTYPLLPRVPYTFGLRAAPNVLLGRAEDIAGVEVLMTEGRLTTILGIGGLGKTRMAQELANRRVQQRKSSVMVVELASIRTPDDLWLTLAEAAGVQDARAVRTLQDKRPVIGLRSRTLTRLSEAPTLLVMDNCEHMVEEAAAVIAEILALCPDISVLATSRSPLSIAGERLYQLQPLNTGDELNAGAAPSITRPAAVALFYERALAARPGVRLDDAVVRRLCQQLDGLPLAIELAAARVRLMNVEDIENRLARRFELLVNTDRSAPERHRTLTAVIEWSWELLAANERSVARRLARFPSGFSLAAARATAGTVPDLTGETLSTTDVEVGVEALINQSLVLVDEDATTGSLRFRMLETVREFAALKLVQAAETPAVEQAMAEWAIEFSLQALANSSGPAQIETIGHISAEQENLLHVLRTAIAGGTPEDARTVFATFGILASYWSQRGMHGEVFTLAEPILGATLDYVPDPQTVDAAVFSLSVITITTMIFGLRKGVVARARLARIKRSGLPLSPRMEAMAAMILVAGSDTKAAILMAQLHQNPVADVAILAFLISGMWAENNGEPELSITFAERAYQLAEGIQDTWAAGSAADNAAQLYSQSGQAAKALLWGQRAIDRMTLVGASSDVRTTTVVVALNHATLGQTVAARSAFDRAKAMPAVDEHQSDLIMFETAAAAEIEFSAHQVDQGLKLYRSLGQPTRGKRNEGPMGLIMAAAQICAELLYNDSALDDPSVAKAVKRLRLASIAVLRVSPRIIDKPVLGTTALAVGSWHALTAEPGSQRAGVGLELLALAQLFASRQDEHVLHRNQHEATAILKHGLAAWENAKRSAANLVQDKELTTERSILLYSNSSLRRV